MPERRDDSYPRQVGGLTVNNQYEARLAESVVAHRQAGNDEAARVAQFELAGRLAARENRGRFASSGYGAAEAFGFGNWFADTAGVVAGLGNREAMPRTREERAAWRHGLRAGMQTENPVGYYGGQILATLPAAEAATGRVIAAAPGLAAREGQRLANIGRAGAVAVASEAPLATTRSVANQVTGRYEDDERGLSAPLQDTGLELLASGAFSSGLNALGAAAGPSARGIARWFGYDPEGLGLVARRSAEAQLEDPARLQRLQDAGAIDIPLRPSSAVTSADAAEIARIAQRSRSAQAGFEEAANQEARSLQGGMQQGIRRAADAVDMREPIPLPDQPAPPGDARTATSTGVDYSRQPLTTQTGVRRTTAAELSDEASAFADEAMSALEAQNPTVVVPRELVNTLLGPGLGDNIGRVIDPTTGTSAHGALLDRVQASQGGPVVLPLRLLESIRSGINNLSKIEQPGVTPEALRNVEDALRTTIRAQVPAYGTYLDELSARGYSGRLGQAAAESGASPATGFRGGQQVLSDAPDVFSYAAAGEGRPGNIGRAEGTVARLTDEAGRSPNAAAQLAEQLATPTGNISRNVATALGEEAADPLRRAASVVSDAVERQRQITNLPTRTGAEAVEEAGRVSGIGAASAMNRGVLGIPALVGQAFDMAAVPPAMANRLQRALSTRDLDEAQRVLRDMDAVGVDMRRWNEFAGQNMPGLVVTATPAPINQPRRDAAPQPVQTEAGGVPAPVQQQIDADAAATLEGMLRDAYAEGDDEAALDYLTQLDRLSERTAPTAGAASTSDELEARIRDAYVAGNDDLAGSLLDEYDRQFGSP